MPEDLVYKSFGVSAITPDVFQGILEGYAAKYGNIDSDGDIIEYGAFKNITPDAINTKIKLLANHDTKLMPGKILALQDNKEEMALKFQVQLYEGHEINGVLTRQLVLDKTLNNASVGFKVKSSYSKTHDGQRVRVITEAELFEFSLVSIPANAGATVNSMKSVDNEPRHEKLLKSEINSISKIRAALKEYYGFNQMDFDAILKVMQNNTNTYLTKRLELLEAKELVDDTTLVAIKKTLLPNVNKKMEREEEMKKIYLDIKHLAHSDWEGFNKLLHSNPSFIAKVAKFGEKYDTTKV